MKHIAILIESLYEDLEVNYPFYRLREEGFSVSLAGTQKGVEYKGKYGYPRVSDCATKDLSEADFDAVVIPGGFAPDLMRRHSATLEFVSRMDKAGRVVASICHGGWILASACDMRGRKATSFFAIKDDLIHAGADYVDMEVVRDRNLITSRKPDDLPAFVKEIISALK